GLLVRADASQLEQAFLNLMLNALEAMPNGGKLTITSRLFRLPRKNQQPTHVVVEFNDTGAGMNEDLRRRAFRSILSTTKPQGTGLGLAIVGRIVEAHRGKIKVLSRLEKGTTIRITLPLE